MIDLKSIRLENNSILCGDMLSWLQTILKPYLCLGTPIKVCSVRCSAISSLFLNCWWWKKKKIVWYLIDGQSKWKTPCKCDKHQSNLKSICQSEPERKTFKDWQLIDLLAFYLTLIFPNGPRIFIGYLWVQN